MTLRPGTTNCRMVNCPLLVNKINKIGREVGYCRDRSVVAMAELANKDVAIKEKDANIIDRAVRIKIQ